MRALGLGVAIAAAASVAAGAEPIAGQPVAAPPRPAPSPAIPQLARALPAGWRLIATADALVIRRARPVRVAAHNFVHPQNSKLPIAAPSDAPQITLELRYRLEPAWDPRRLAAARATNARIDAQLAAARDRHDAAEHARLRAQRVAIPRCTIDGRSLFDDAARAQLDLIVDPPAAMREAYAIIELVKRRCR